MSVVERDKLLRCCKREAKIDLSEQRKRWVKRYMLTHLALNSGCRIMEIANLKISDIHFNGKENYLSVFGKGNKKRDVYIDDEIVEHLKSYILIKKDLWRESVENEAPLFAGRAGKHYTTTALEISFKKAIIRAGLSSHYSCHSCRHTYATLLLAKSKNIRFVARQLGHASLNMTALYADILPEMNQNLANTLLK